MFVQGLSSPPHTLICDDGVLVRSVSCHPWKTLGDCMAFWGEQQAPSHHLWGAVGCLNAFYSTDSPSFEHTCSIVVEVDQPCSEKWNCLHKAGVHSHHNHFVLRLPLLYLVLEGQSVWPSYMSDRRLQETKDLMVVLVTRSPAISPYLLKKT